ncbi:L-seryl-tRNA(Sec) kinase-like [Antedon mediterranea]|uniref:L-seryl-tRNA(Sec) kinase-like n=1 Tax=Antedon mediterranea TaxID=105859 RepID=UPI003AF9F352
MTRKCLIIILCGIPAVGKSTFAIDLLEKLKTNDADELRKVATTWVCFDDIIPNDGLDVEYLVSNPNDESKRHGIWKEYRISILRTVDEIISKIVKDGAPLLTEQPEQDDGTDNIYKYVRTKVQKQFKSSLQKFLKTNGCSCSDSKDENYEMGTFLDQDVLNNTNFIFILDDNFYYKSMRYQYFQICKKYSISFCQIQINCPLEVAVIRNRSRRSRVADDTIIDMATRFEALSGSGKDSWEMMSIEIDGSKELTEDTWLTVFALVQKAWSHPVPPVEVEDHLQKEESRLGCLKSIIHQGDQTLRRLISEKMKMNKEEGMPKSQMKVQSLKLNQARQEILESLREGTLTPQLSDDWDIENKLRAIFNQHLDEHKKV